MKLILSIFLFLSYNIGTAQYFASGGDQIQNPVSWKAGVVQENDSIYTLTFTAIIEPGWHLYSQEAVEEGGPLPTAFSFNDEEGGFALIGKTLEPEGIALYDPVFEMDIKYFEEQVSFVQKIRVSGEKDPEITAEVFFMVCNETQCLAPETVPFTISVGSREVSRTSIHADVSQKDQALTAALDIQIKGNKVLKLEEAEQAGYLSLFLLGFVGGLIALLTPCVFPMIPLTVSFFTKGAGTKRKGLINAIMYGVFIFMIYLLLSLPFHLLDSLNPEILNNISTNVTLNLIFFVIFLVFAFSFFGYYEITLPSSWSNKMDDKASSFGGVVGVFFMALTLAIVSFSCTGPILGSLLGSSLTVDGGAMQLSFGMGGFGLSLALPFALFALFPNWLNSLPKSGGWLNVVKVVLGFIELALAFKFFSNADLVQHWGILKREIFIGIWVLIGLGLLLYLFGVIRFPQDGPKKKLSKGRLFLGLITLAFVVYLVPGLSNTPAANLKLLSGFPPPLFYSIYEKETEGPLGLKAYKDFEEGVEAARAADKPILLDFTGWACVNCRKMEEQVWSDPEVYDLMREEFILVSLYVDDRKELPEAEQFNYIRPNGSIKKIRTVGDKWATFQTLNFRNNSQPYYVIMDSRMNLLQVPTGYTPDPQEYQAWLSAGLKEFRKDLDVL